MDKLTEPPRRPTKPKIYGFYHIATLGIWKTIVDEQLLTIFKSGLYDESEAIFVSVVGPQVKDLVLPSKFRIVYQSQDPGCFERKILLYMHQFCSNGKADPRVWYIHSKGVQHSENPIMSANVRDWRRFMEHFVITRYQTCLDALEQSDTCGCNIMPWPSTHYSGNFWWARGAYVKTLASQPDEDYVGPEMWICSNAEGRHHCLFQSGVAHYEERYSEENYIGASADGIREPAEGGDPDAEESLDDKRETDRAADKPSQDHVWMHNFTTLLQVDGKPPGDTDVDISKGIKSLYPEWGISHRSSGVATHRINAFRGQKTVPFGLKRNIATIKDKIRADIVSHAYGNRPPRATEEQQNDEEENNHDEY